MISISRPEEKWKTTKCLRGRWRSLIVFWTKGGMWNEQNKIFSAYAMTSLDYPFKFELEELEIEKTFPDSTYYFGGSLGHRTDQECKLRFGTAFYSTDKHKCKDYLINKMREMNELSNKIHDLMQESKLEIKYLEDEE